jgi:multidrug resistance efflux pump
MFQQKLVAVEVQSESAGADMEAAKLLAKRADTTANRSMEMAQACQVEVKALERRMAALKKIQDDMVPSVSRFKTSQCRHRGFPLVALMRCPRIAYS